MCAYEKHTQIRFYRWLLVLSAQLFLLHDVVFLYSENVSYKKSQLSGCGAKCFSHNVYPGEKQHVS